ncbi:hypothetical protein [Streptomyces sp. MZ04]|uniref:hypothetical protein n=1 Tax=Streptomyces sp. MZ04 TaxID=2559236 RepID=UPI00107ED245|nr:hypothetical protein [Streptomyces sp. MZ04]TGA86313.1 hypothetical protein E2651_41250 [Streptomyces sp. MZ04]
MPASILEGAEGLIEVAAPSRAAVPFAAIALLTCPSCGSSHVAQVLGDNGGVSYVCTACGRSWS